MVTGLTPGFYTTRDAKYEVQADGTIWLVAGNGLEGDSPQRVPELPPDAAMTHAALENAPYSGGTTPPGKRE